MIATGQAIQIVPGSQPWLAGLRFGEVRAIDTKRDVALVHLDHAGRVWLPLATIIEGN